MDQGFLEKMENERVEFRKREKERNLIRAKLQSLLNAIDDTDSECRQFERFGNEERYRLAQAKVQIFEALRSVEAAANDLIECNHRASESFLAKYSE